MPTILLYLLGVAIVTFTCLTVRFMVKNALFGAAIRLRTAMSESGEFPTQGRLDSGSASGARPFTHETETGGPA